MPYRRDWVVSVGIEERLFVDVRNLKLSERCFEVLPSHRGIFHLPGADAPPEFIKVHIEISQLDSRPNRPGPNSESVSFDLGPSAPFDDNGHALR